MIKYYNAMVVFEEIPDEITIAINITNCPCHCVGCHSKFLWEDIGKELTFEELERLIEANKGITCVCFMGGDATPHEINDLAEKVHLRSEYSNIKIAWYSGRDELSSNINLRFFNYIKLGHYDDNMGPLNKKTTNQRLYKIGNNVNLEDITYKFWEREKGTSTIK